MAPYHPRIKICCIASVAEARLAARYGADALGLVSAMPSGPGVIPEARIREIARAALFLASDAAKNIYGQDFVVDGGYTIG